MNQLEKAAKDPAAALVRLKDEWLKAPESRDVDIRTFGVMLLLIEGLRP